ALGVREVPVAAGDLEARREPLHVPLERTRQRFVEVVEVEDELALRGGVAADVREVGVAAELRLQTRSRGRREVVGHHGRCTAVERERGDEHPAVAQRNKLRDTRGRLCLENRYRVAIGRELEVPMARPRALLPGGAASRGALGSAEVQHRWTRCGLIHFLLFVDGDNEISFLTPARSRTRA